MKKSILSLALVGVMIISSSAIAYADTVSYSKYSYLEKVQADNFDLNQINDDLEDELKEYKVALRARTTIKEMTWDDFNDNYDDSASRLNAAQIKLYNHIKEGKEYLDTYIEQQQTLQNIVLEGEANYFNYLFAKRNLDNKVDSFNLTKSKYDTKVLEHELGKISDIELLSYEKTYNDSFVAQLEASNAFEQAKNEFNQYVSEPINTEVDLQDVDIVLPEFQVEDLDATLSTLLENSYQLQTLKLELERLQADRTLKGRYAGFSDTKIELEELEISIEETTQQIEDMKLDLDYQFRTKYNNALSAYNSFRSAELALEIEQSNLKIARIKNENNMISALDYIESQQSYDSALNSYYSSKLSAYKTIKGFNNFITLNSTAVNMDLK
ncbi:MAG: TolC family protein [Clostridia bacterium]|nr:TolC family protein [Clostridia bacterium]